MDCVAEHQQRRVHPPGRLPEKRQRVGARLVRVHALRRPARDRRNRRVRRRRAHPGADLEHGDGQLRNADGGIDHPRSRQHDARGSLRHRQRRPARASSGHDRGMGRGVLGRSRVVGESRLGERRRPSADQRRHRNEGCDRDDVGPVGRATARAAARHRQPDRDGHRAHRTDGHGRPVLRGRDADAVLPPDGIGLVRAQRDLDRRVRCQEGQLPGPLRVRGLERCGRRRHDLAVQEPRDLRVVGGSSRPGGPEHHGQRLCGQHRQPDCHDRR